MNNEMYLTQHFKELKTRVLSILAFFTLSFGICYYFKQQIFMALALPLKKMFSNDESFIYTHIAEVFFSYLKISFWVSLLITLPFILIQIYLFIAPGLYKKEKKLIIPTTLLSYTLFALGIAFTYFIIMPNVWSFFINFAHANSIETNAILQAKISEYLTFSLQLMLAFGLAFQLPILLIILAKCNIICQQSLKNGRKYAILAIAVFSAFITPPDIISQIMLIAPMYLLYEITIILLKKIR